MKDYTYNHIAVIIPIHEMNDEYLPLLKKALDSTQKNLRFNSKKGLLESDKNIKKYVHLYIVSPKEVMEKYNDVFSNYTFTYIESDLNNLSIQNQLNIASKEVKEEYFVFLEFDDELYENFYDIYNKHINSFDASLYLPLTIDIDVLKNQLLYFSNVFLWSPTLDDKTEGILSLDNLKNYPISRLSGSLIKTDVYKKYNGLKNKIKYYFNYEFLLRLIYNNEQIRVMNKISYRHNVNRKGSFSSIYRLNENVSRDEVQFWIETSEKEFYYNDESIRPDFRIKTFEE